MTDFEFHFGQPVSISHKLTREHQSRAPLPAKIWRPTKLPLGVEGIIIGVRTLADGAVQYGGYDEATAFYPESHFRAYLVAFALHRRPILARPEHLAALDQLTNP